jgi:hypothetical protein
MFWQQLDEIKNKINIHLEKIYILKEKFAQNLSYLEITLNISFIYLCPS